jgi:peptidylprolyl isomerase
MPKIFMVLLIGAFLAFPALAAEADFAGEVSGQKVTQQEFDFAYKTNFIFSISGREAASEAERRSETWQFLALQKEADKKGIVTSPQELESELSRLLAEKNVKRQSYNYFVWVQENFKEDHKVFESRMESALKVRKFLESIKSRQVLLDLFTKASIKDYKHDQILAIETNQGTFEVKLYPDIAPKACENFTKLAQQGYYDGILFHRVIDGFMIQGGDPTATGSGGKSVWREPFEDEVTQSVGFDRPGLLAMANSGPNTNGSQFFITVAPKPYLNMIHTIFGEVISGFDVVKKISQTPTSGEPLDRPLKEQKIIHITRKNWL